MKFTEKYPGETVRALSWKQPFASLMLHGKVETRVWDSKYTGWVLICASKKAYSYKEVIDISGEHQFSRMQNTLGTFLPTGQAIAIGRLVSSRKMDSFGFIRSLDAPPIDYSFEMEKRTFVKYNPELWCHNYRDVQPIVPFVWSGTQGWKTLDQETFDKIILL